MGSFYPEDLDDVIPQPVPDVSQPDPQILVSPGTPLACTNCHRVGAPLYFLKRDNGKYAVLCCDSGKGCWEHSARNLCTYSDPESQCMDLAEYLVVYGTETEMTRRAVCARHVPAVLGGASGYQIFPIDD